MGRRSLVHPPWVPYAAKMAWLVRDRRARRDTGVALVEYALVLGLFVIGSLGAIQFLEDETANEVDSQADCISERPPPSSCQPAAATPLDGTGGGAGGDPGGGDPGPTEVAAFQPTTVTATRGAAPKYTVDVDLTIFDDMAQPLEGELISAQVRITQSTVPGRLGQIYYASCSTDASGKCTMSFDSRYNDVTQVSFRVIAVGADTSYDFGTFNEILISQPPPNSTVTGTG